MSKIQARRVRHNAQQTGADSIHYDDEKKSLKKFEKGVDNRREKRYTIDVPKGAGSQGPYYTIRGKRK